MDLKKLSVFLKDNGAPAFRIKQAADAVYKNFAASWDEVPVLPAALREALHKGLRIHSVDNLETLVSKKGDAVKFCFGLKDGLKVESVLLNLLPEKWSICLSTQVGCPVRCPFCATGRKGLKRNLSPEEITDQFLAAAHYLKKTRSQKISNVIFMGMGEPLLNYDSVAEAIRALAAPDRVGLGQRHISVSTAGHVPGIRRFAKDFPQCNLAISLHATEDALRSDLVPLNNTYPLGQLAKALTDYIGSTKRRVFVEYVMLEGVNSSRSQAARLNSWLRSVAAPKYFVVNLIPYNRTGGQYRTPARERIKVFADLLETMGLEVTVRKSLGEDISGACGQLAG
ncbi:MAG: 23S rRNA (adenine(2503)-C(2))-methyltransferase [Elusimicrobia bacterium RIFOXYA2_FULL_58_8]|nr:MAG: 23S rRNA (adenine(2503)-C(2))-methyltransferase [Elusimicrobia bacterium RIFOXYA2_FULL_58_8]OGS14439.1 MAG: 23S rRNA (adenine(2503)-C(2))-methyltransferase [Elusimicrobia bacterium RIFOXYA12_FULL_57_11]